MPPRGFFSSAHPLASLRLGPTRRGIAVHPATMLSTGAPASPLRQQTLERRGLGLPRSREDLLHRLTSLDGVDERWLLAQWHLVEGGSPCCWRVSRERSFRAVLTFVTRLQLADLAVHRDFALDRAATCRRLVDRIPRRGQASHCILFRQVLDEISPIPNDIPDPRSNVVCGNQRGRAAVSARCVNGLVEASRAVLYLSFYAGLTAGQVRVVVSRHPATSREEVVGRLERAYIEVLDRMSTLN